MKKYARTRQVKEGYKLSACFVGNVGDTPCSNGWFSGCKSYNTEIVLNKDKLDVY